MKPSVYVETTIISYLAARPSRDTVIAGHQRVTSEWWSRRRSMYEVVISDAVVIEAVRGDSAASARRLALLDGIRRVPLDEAARTIARQLVARGGLPTKAAQDAVHVAAAASARADFLMTWNCSHIANAALRPRIESICLDAGFRPPVICTPLELMETPP